MNKSSVTLTATPTTHSFFRGLSGGGCSGAGTCTVTITASTSVTANFIKRVRDDIDGDGKTDPSKYDASTHTLSWLNTTTGSWTNLDMGTGTFTVVDGQ
jgi:hypothetical protein